LKTELKRYLKKHQGHLGRGGEAIQALAARAEVSVHMIQSVAMGRKKFSEATAARVSLAMGAK